LVTVVEDTLPPSISYISNYRTLSSTQVEVVDVTREAYRLGQFYVYEQPWNRLMPSAALEGSHQPDLSECLALWL
jgi:hypothetical protein